MSMAAVPSETASIATDAGIHRAAVAPARPAWSLRSRLTWLGALVTMFAWLTGGAGVLIAAAPQAPLARAPAPDLFRMRGS